MPARFSSLPVLQYCGGSARINAAGGAGRAAAMGSAFHALCSGAPEARSLWVALSDDEQAEVESWKRPADITLGSVALSYADAQKEVACGLNAFGRHVPKGDPKAVVEGTADMFWCVNGVLYLADIKRSEKTVADGCDSLQLHGYALALADREGATAYRCGIWAAVEGAWEWGPEISLESPAAAMAWERISVASSRESSELAMGPHCSKCYARQRCPAYLVDPERAEVLAAPLLTNELDNETAARLLAAIERLDATLKMAKDRVQAFARENGGIASAGRVWKPSLVQGRLGLDRRALERDHPNLVELYTTRGAAFERFGWTKAKP